MLVDHVEPTNISVEDAYKNTALHRAALRGHKTIVQTLTDQGGSIRATNDNDKTALDLAADEKHLGTKWTLVCRTTQKDDVNYIKEFLNTQIQADEVDHDGRALLSYAAEYGREVVIEIPHKKGADIEI
jgi:hypothetical protein